MSESIFKKFGKPSLQIKGLRLWIHCRQFYNARDYWDGNWLIASIYCIDNEKETRILYEPFLRTNELKELKEKFNNLLLSINRENFQTMEPYLSIEIERKSIDELVLNINITSNPVDNYQTYTYELNTPDLEVTISELNEILSQYPVIGKP